MTDWVFGLLLPSEKKVYVEGALISLDELKKHLNVDADEDDTLIEGYRDAALAWIGKSTNRTIVPAQLTLRRDCFWTKPLALPYGPIRSIDSISYRDGDGVMQSIAPENYELVDRAVGLAWGATWPSAPYREAGITIAYSAGYDALPKPLKHAAFMLVAHWYNSRETASASTQTSVPFGVDALIWPFRILSV